LECLSDLAGRSDRATERSSHICQIHSRTDACHLRDIKHCSAEIGCLAIRSKQTAWSYFDVKYKAICASGDLFGHDARCDQIKGTSGPTSITNAVRDRVRRAKLVRLRNDGEAKVLNLSQECFDPSLMPKSGQSAQLVDRTRAMT
jgi:hypothetical protein